MFGGSMIYSNKNHNLECRGTERFLESKLIEADRNILFALAFEANFSHISDICNNIAEDNIEDVKNVGRILLGGGYNPKLRINGEMSSIELKNDFSCKGPYSAVSVLNYNAERINRITVHTKNLLLGDEIIRYNGLIEVMNKILLRDFEKLEKIRKILNTK